MTPPLDPATVRACAEMCDASRTTHQIEYFNAPRDTKEEAQALGAVMCAVSLRDAILALLPPAPEVSHG
jgi:hypothetical protein